MSARWISAAMTATALGFGLSAGVFFAFSTFVMPALGRLPNNAGIAAMRSINVAAINLPFLGVLFGSGALATALAMGALARRSQPGTGLSIAAALVYLIGTLGVTMAFNVPLNDALADAADDASAAQVWARYLVTWTAWNHVRALAALVAASLLVAALCERARVASGANAPRALALSAAR